MKIIFLSGSFLLLICGISSFRVKTTKIEVDNQMIETAIQDFSKSRLYRGDAVFRISLYDTLQEMELKNLTEYKAAWVPGRVYPDIMAVDIHAYRNRFFLDTTVSISSQTAIPSHYMELNGKLFFWYDKHCPLTNNTIKKLNEYDRIRRGGPDDSKRYDFVSDESIKTTDYYFCRSNLTNFKKIVTTYAIGYYNPPDISCK